MCQPRKWFWGLLPLAALWAGAIFVLTPQIESELTHRVITTVRHDLPWLKPAVEGRDVNIEGKAPSLEAKRKAMDAVLQVDGARLAIDAAALIPEAKPFTWSATRDGQKVLLAGYVAPEGVREQVLAEARKQAPGATIVDDMLEARGASVALPAMTTLALGTLGKLKSGSVALVDTKFAIKGVTADQATANAIIASTKKLPVPLQLASVEVTSAPPAAPIAAAAAPAPKAPVVPVERPYVWQGLREGNSIALSGSVPSESARTQVVAAAKSALGGGRVVDQLKVATGLPASVDFGVATSFALSQLGQLRNGTAKLTDGALEVEGETIDAAGYRAVTAATTGTLPTGLKLERSALTPPRASNYAWSAKREGKSLTLSGYYPDEGTRYAMEQAVKQRFADLKLTDKTSIASGAPAGFPAALGMGLDQLSQLDSGEASIANGRLTISGVAPDEKTVGEIKSALTKLVGGMPAESKVTFVPPPAPPTPAAPPPAPPAPAAAVAPVASAPPVPAAPAPAAVPAPAVAAVAAAPAIPPAAPTVAPPVKPVAPPTAVAPPATVEAPAVVAKPAVAPPVSVPVAPKVVAPPQVPAATPAPKVAAATPPAAQPALKVVPAPTPAPTVPAAAVPAVAAPATPPKPAVSVAACPANVAATIKSGRIRFNSAKAEVGISDRKALVRVIRALKTCGNVKFEVAGHTDNVGSSGYNEKLSKSRAEAIRALLVKRGIDAGRIRTAGYGLSKPVADNNTAAGRAQNRRIQFTLVE